MKQKIKSLLKEERGNIMVLFAGSLIVMIAFIGLALDVGMLSLQRNALQNLNQVIREDRFTYQDTIKYATDPAKESYKIIYNTLAENGFDGTVKVYFYEETPTPHHREYHIRTVLSKEFSWSFARVLGLTTSNVSATLDGEEIYGDGVIDMIWNPDKSELVYSGSYTSKPGDPFTVVTVGYPAYTYDAFIPADMIT